MKRKILIAAALLGGLIPLVGGLLALGMLALVVTMGTAVVAVPVDTTVLDRRTHAPVPACLLAFDMSPTPDSGRDTTRTDAQGRSTRTTRFDYVGSILSPFARERDLHLRFYIGEPPHVATYGQAETWAVRLRFRQPWWGREVTPTVEVQRSLAHEEVLMPPPGKKWQNAGFLPIPTDKPETLVEARVRFESHDHRDVYRVPLTVFLEQDQIDLCQSPTQFEAQEKAFDEFSAGRYADALETYRTSARTMKDAAWVWSGMGSCLAHLGRKQEESEAYRKALDLEPNDIDILFEYGNSLIFIRDKEAVSVLENVVAREPTKTRGLLDLAVALYNLHRVKESIEANRKAAELAPKDPEALYWYANALLNVNDQQSADLFKKVVAIEPDQARGLIGLATALYNLDLYQGSIDAFARASALCGSCMSAENRSIESEAKRLLAGR